MPEPVLADADLTPGWLTEALGAAGVEGVVTAVRSRPIGTGQMSGSFRLDLTWVDPSPDAPSSLVAKLASSDPEVRAFAGSSAYVAECRFYAELATSLPVPTPRSWYSQSAVDASCFTLLLQDCAPAEQGDQIAGCSVAEARVAIEAAAGLHGATWCDDTIRTLPYLLPFGTDVASMLQELLIGLVPTFVERLGIEPADSRVLEAFAAGLAGWVTGRPERFALLHNDFRLDNLLFDPRPDAIPAVYVVDWQTLSFGLPARDIAYFLATSLLTGMRRESERELVAGYAASLERFGVSAADRSMVWEDYVFGLFQAPLILVLGSMNSAPTERGEEMFRVATERACAAIRDLDAIDLL